MIITTESILLLAMASFVVGLTLGRFTRSETRSPTQPVQLETLPKDLEERLQLLIGRGQKIAALKELRTATGMGLKEAKDIVDSMASGGSLRNMISSSTTATPAISQITTDISTEAMGKVQDLLRSGKKIEALKAYREASGLSLKEAKDNIDKMARELSI